MDNIIRNISVFTTTQTALTLGHCDTLYGRCFLFAFIHFTSIRLDLNRLAVTINQSAVQQEKNRDREQLSEIKKNWNKLLRNKNTNASIRINIKFHHPFTATELITNRFISIALAHPHYPHHHHHHHHHYHSLF